VLLVDDEPLVRKSIARVLERSGLTVHSAGDAARATSLAREHARDIGLLLLDVRMPDTSGPELAEALAHAGVHAPVLFMSGYVPDDVDADRLGESAYLQKPFPIDELLRRVGELLDAAPCDEEAADS
jgi:DNA-binding response OmpR family regulator